MSNYYVEIVSNDNATRNVEVIGSSPRMAVAEAISKLFGGNSRSDVYSHLFKLCDDHAEEVSLDSGYTVCRVSPVSSKSSDVVYAYNPRLLFSKR